MAQVEGAGHVLLLSDEIYGKLHHENRHASIVPHYPEGTIFSGGLSKWCGAGGWRLGVFVIPGNMQWLIDAMTTVASETFTSTSAPIQHAAVRAFKGGAEIEEYLRRCRIVLRVLGQALASRLSQAGVRVLPPEGGFYLFPDFSPFAEALRKRGIRTSRDFCERLLEDTGVALLPGSDFGRPPAELTARLAYVDFDGARALRAVDDEFLKDPCGRILEAADRIIGWLNHGDPRI